MGTRYPKEYCPHCRDEVWCVFKGPALYCQYHDHYVRPRRAAKSKRPALQADQGADNYHDLKYYEIQRHIGLTVSGRGLYSWEELAIWAGRMQFDDLAGLCEDLRQANEYLTS